MVAEPSGTVTFMFTDIVGSTATWERDPEAMRACVELHDGVVRDVLSAFGGHVFSPGGDGFAVSFGRADAACAAAPQLQRRLGAVEWPNHLAIGVRVGIHTGETSERDGSYFGPAVNRAARLTASAHAGQIVVSMATQQIVNDHLPPDVELTDLGTVRLAGLPAPMRAFGLRAPGLAGDHRPLRGSSNSYGNLPSRVEPLVGRTGEVDRLADCLRSTGLTTLAGVGGVGKTSVALAVAEATSSDFPDGIWWIELASVEAGADVPSAIAACLGVQCERATSPTDCVVSALAGRQSLLVLDNCEHVASAAAEIVDQLRTRVPTLTLLVTSRQPLGVTGERVERLTPLDFATSESSAVRLFLDRLGVGGLDDDDLAAVLDICARLDGLPLAIELAAGRCRVLRPQDVAARLGHRLATLQGPHDRADRQRTLHATLQWSYDLLTPIERLLLQRLSVFVGGFSLEAAEAICGGGEIGADDVVDCVAALVERSLIERTDAGYRLLQTTRDFARHQLDDRTTEALDGTHARYFVDFADECRIGLRTTDEARWVARLDADWANLRSAFRTLTARGDVEAVTALVTALAPEAFWRRPELLEWADAAIASSRSSSSHAVTSCSAPQRGRRGHLVTSTSADGGPGTRSGRNRGEWRSTICRSGPKCADWRGPTRLTGRPI